jgi:peptidoglycan hydrolase CwlO-like protein
MPTHYFTKKLSNNASRWALLLLISLMLIGGGLHHATTSIQADEVEELQKQIDELSKLRQMSESATQNLEVELKTIRSKINVTLAQLNSADAQTKTLETNIDKREADLSDHYDLLKARVRSYYKLTRQFSPFATLFSISTASGITRQISYHSAVASQDKEAIVDTTQDILNLEADKKALDQRKAQLKVLRSDFEKNAVFFEGEIKGAKSYQADLTTKIAQLSAQQQAIISARSGSQITSVGSVPVGSDFNASIAGFTQNAPGGSFAAFSFGGHTHRKGMSQYGAKARAESGQSSNEILKNYYGKEPVDKDTGGSISVSGVGDVDFENYYLLGIAEMPSSWHKEALKAQAVAARTYAYRYKSEGKSICTTEACQVFSKSKADNPPSEWKQAVEETRGKVLEDVVTYYSSTAGGYLTTSGWDTTDKSGSGEWTTRAWESKAGSPWFYKAWYRQGYANSSNDCGRNPWLSESEMADIINAWLVLKKGEGKDVDTGRVIPVTINQCSIGGQSGNPYSLEELRSHTNSPVTSISGKPAISHNNDGQTTNVRFQTNRGEINIPGGEFKQVFNTRAPGFISIPQSGFAFFNIERK